MKYLPILCLGLGLFCLPGLRAETPGEKKEVAAGDQDFTAWKWANFVVLFGVIAYYGVKIGKPYFEGQTHTINQGLEEARRHRAEAERRSAEVQQKLANLGVEIERFRTEVLEEQRRHAARLAETLLDELERINTGAAKQIETVAKRERLALQRHAAALALRLAEERLRSNMNAETQNSLTRQFVERLRA